MRHHRSIFAALTICCLFSSLSVSAQVSDRFSLREISGEMESLTLAVSPAVVEILATGYSASASGETTASLLTQQRSSGSGVILDSEGYCITNAHVVDDARRIVVTLAVPNRKEIPMTSILKTRGQTVKAELVGIDRETDLAVLKLNVENVPALKLGNSDDLRQGQLVLALGSPLGLQNSVSMGVVSSVARQLKPDSPMVYIQTDAPINPGNSGGPLIDSNGSVIGINTMIMSQSGGNEGIGFAVPSNIVRTVYEQIRKHGRVRRGEIGVRVQTITPLMSSGLGLNKDWGVVVSDVLPGSPGERSGLRIGDIIDSMDGKPMENGRQFEVNLYRRAVGEIVVLKIRRGNSSNNVRVRVIEREDDQFKFADFVNPQDNLVPELGILGIDLDQRLLRMLPMIRIREGVLVASRSREGLQREGALMPGDVIHTLNKEQISNLNNLREILANLQPGDPLILQVERNGRMHFVALEYEAR